MTVDLFRQEITERKRRMSPALCNHILSRRTTKNPVNQLAALRRAALIEALGGCCVKCGSEHKLEFDHKDPETRTWEAKDYNQYMRIIKYEHDAAEGLIQLLCKRCNQAKGSRPQRPQDPF